MAPPSAARLGLLALAALRAPLVSADNGFCANATHASWPICDMAAPLAARAADLLSRLSLADKVLLTVHSQPALPDIGLAGYDWWTEATHGVAGGAGPATNTGLPITTSCSFNRSLWRATGNAIGREARAYINTVNLGSTFWAPVINIVRDPRQVQKDRRRPRTATLTLNTLHRLLCAPPNPTHTQMGPQHRVRRRRALGVRRVRSQLRRGVPDRQGGAVPAAGQRLLQALRGERVRGPAHGDRQLRAAAGPRRLLSGALSDLCRGGAGLWNHVLIQLGERTVRKRESVGRRRRGGNVLRRSLTVVDRNPHSPTVSRTGQAAQTRGF